MFRTVPSVRLTSCTLKMSLLDAVLKHAEVRCSELVNEVTVLVGDDRVDADACHRRPEHGRLNRRQRRLSQRREYRNSGCACDADAARDR